VVVVLCAKAQALAPVADAREVLANVPNKLFDVPKAQAFHLQNALWFSGKVRQPKAFPPVVKAIQQANLASRNS
jgi:hypothetical protein